MENETQMSWKTECIRSNTTRQNYVKVIAHRVTCVACLSTQQTCHGTCYPLHVGVVLTEADLKEMRRNMLNFLGQHNEHSQNPWSNDKTKH